MNKIINVPKFVAKEYMPVVPMSFIKDGNGITQYKGVVIVWDEDFNSRIFDLIDMILEEHKEALCEEFQDSPDQILLAVSEHKGCVRFLWMNVVPSKYTKGEKIAAAFDYWDVTESIVLEDPFEEEK